MNRPAFPPDNGAVLIPGPVGQLEVAVEYPDPAVPARALTLIVCHPLPTGGGSMDNKVVTMVARSLRELGATAVRFNFRGTGRSDGRFDNGTGERADLRAVAAWVRAQRPDDALWLAGFSFGAYVSLAMQAELHPGLLLSIAPPVGRWDFSTIPAPRMPWVVIQGEDDDIVDAQAVYAWLAALDARAELIRMPATGHFFHGKMIDLRGAIRHSVSPWLPGPATPDDR